MGMATFVVLNRMFWLFNRIPFQVGFLVALIAQLVALMLVLYVFPETLPLSEAKEEAERANPKDAGTFSLVPEAAAAAAGAEEGGYLCCTASSTKYNPVSLMRILSTTKATRRLSTAWFFRGMVIAGASSSSLALVPQVLHDTASDLGYAGGWRSAPCSWFRIRISQPSRGSQLAASVTAQWTNEGIRHGRKALTVYTSTGSRTPPYPKHRCGLGQCLNGGLDRGALMDRFLGGIACGTFRPSRGSVMKPL
jgi:hypothetical protein